MGVEDATEDPTVAFFTIFKLVLATQNSIHAAKTEVEIRSSKEVSSEEA